MRDDVLEALESAADVENSPKSRFAKSAGDDAVRRLRARIYAFVRELPDDMCIAELRAELEPDHSGSL